MKQIKANQATASFKVGIVMSQFNGNVTHALLEGALERLAERGVHAADITVVEVPGAVEIPLIAEQLAMMGKQSAIIALGAVIRGETTHYDYVCQQVSDGCHAVMMRYQIPVIFGVLTTENYAQAEDRLGGKHGHKGKEAADCACDMVSIMQQLRL